MKNVVIIILGALFALTVVACAGSGGTECDGPFEALCDGECIAVNADPFNCGGCNVQCSSGQQCQEGRCVDVDPCPDPALDWCDGCVNLQRDASNCGACGVVCAGGESCIDGVCRRDCGPGLTDCSGTCVDTRFDPHNCGDCGVDCGAAICSGGECQDSCTGGLTECDGACVDTDKDEDNCGDCGVECAEGESCEAGECILRCPGGFDPCDGECVDLLSNLEHCGRCGNFCNPGEVCNEGMCDDTGCADGLTDCSGACVDTDTDRSHCGRCDNDCPAGEACVDGSCGIVCPAGETECSGVCVTLDTDTENCGACGTTCRADQICDGSCMCPGSRTDCSGACVDTRNDPSNCGGCGTTCGAGEACVSSSCTLSCPSGQTACDGYCVDTDSSHDHCGGCGTACGASETCIGGSCVASTIPGDSCASPIDVTGGGHFSGTTAGAGADYSGGCGGITGREVVYEYTLTDESDVYINTFGSSFDTLIYVRETCGGGTDEGCNDDARGTFQSELFLPGQDPGTYYLIIDAWGSGSGDYELDIYMSEPSWREGDACGEPEWFDITTVTTISDHTCAWWLVDARDDSRATCGGIAGGLDFVHYFVVETTTTVTFDTCDADTEFDTLLDLRRVCDSTSAADSIVCDDDDCGSLGLQSSITATLEPGVYYLWVDGWEDSACGEYVITVTTS